MSDADNLLKYGNYKEQMGRLKKAMANRFLLEALFIEYAVIEDRTESILRHAGVFNPEKHDTLARKLNRISEIARGKKSLLGKYITVETVEEIKAWKDERNRLIHALLKQDLTTEELEQIANEGQRLTKCYVPRRHHSEGHWSANDRRMKMEATFNEEGNDDGFDNRFNGG